jgi:hypothetical protein
MHFIFWWKFQPKVLPRVLEANVPDRPSHKFFVIRKLSGFHFIPEQVAQHAAKIFVPGE